MPLRPFFEGVFLRVPDWEPMRLGCQPRFREGYLAEGLPWSLSGTRLLGSPRGSC